DDYLHVRVKRLMVWAESRSIVELQLTAESNPEADLYALALPHFCTSRFLCAPEFRNLVVACRGSCRTLARPDLLEPLMKVSELGYCQIQGLSQTATKRLAWLDEGIRKAQASMRTLGLSSLTPLKAEMKVGEPERCNPRAMAASLPFQSGALLYLHPSLKLSHLGERGSGYVSMDTVKRGELLLEELPFVWDSGSDPDAPDLQAGADWIQSSRLLGDFDVPASDDTPQARALAIASRYAFRTFRPCADGAYPAMLFRACSRFNHSCFPNAGGHLAPGELSESVSNYKAKVRSFRVYALEEIRSREEVCICYLSEAEQLSPLRVRRASLQAGWGFLCHCDRCAGGRPLDRRLEGIDAEFGGDPAFDRKQAAAKANLEFQALFDRSHESYDPPKDFESTVQRLTRFREDHRFLDKAHTVSQRVRRELIAAFLICGTDGEVAHSCATPALALLIEEMHIQHALLPSLSPCKVAPYVQFLQLLKHVSEEEARWCLSDLKVDGCGLQHQQSLWLHDNAEARRLGVVEPRNLPPAPVLGVPLRTGPQAAPGAACGPGLSGPVPPLSLVLAKAGRLAALSIRSQRWPGRCRQRCPKPTQDEMPPLKAAVVKKQLPDLWDVYADFGQPSKEARRLRGRRDQKKGPESWFKFKVSK
ncbi:SET5, partial [Symbiodinium necroappetens]